MNKRLLSIALLTLCVSVESLAVRIQRPFYTLREKGLGSAITAAVDDYSAVMLNPANMASMKEKHVNMGFGGSFNQGFFDFQNDLQDVASLPNTDPTKATKFANLLAKYKGETFAFNPYFYGMYSGPKWGFALIPINTDFNVTISDTTADVVTYVDGIMLAGMGRRYSEKIDWGVTLKTQYRGHVDIKYDATSLVNDELFDSANANIGVTADVDAAINYRLPKWKSMDTKLSFVMRNLVDYGFKIAKQGTSEAPKLGRSLDIGSEYTFPRMWVFQPRLMFDIRDIGVTDWDFQSGYHIGAELNWKTYDWLKGGYRIGINQGYFTAGLNMQLSWFRLDLASWGEEVGTKDNRKELRRVAINMALDF